jgi:hypothetical protein
VIFSGENLKWPVRDRYRPKLGVRGWTGNIVNDNTGWLKDEVTGLEPLVIGVRGK